MLDWLVLANVATVIVPVLGMLISYTRTWSKFEVTIATLTEMVKKLSESMDSLNSNQFDLVQKVAALDARVRALERGNS